MCLRSIGAYIHHCLYVLLFICRYIAKFFVWTLTIYVFSYRPTLLLKNLEKAGVISSGKVYQNDHKMTIDLKFHYCRNEAIAVPKLGLPSYGVSTVIIASPTEPLRDINFFLFIKWPNGPQDDLWFWFPGHMLLITHCLSMIMSKFHLKFS